MNKILDEIKSIPGMIGGFIFNSQKGIRASNLPMIFKEDRLQKIAGMLIKMYSNGRTNFSDILEISIYYDESVLIIRDIGDSTYLIILCDPSINENLLTMSLNLVMGDLKKQKEPHEKISISESGKNKNIGPKNEINGENLLNEGPMSEKLKGMQTALAKIVGPMAKIIFIDALDEWVKIEQPGFSSINTLVKILGREIGDPEKTIYYRNLIEPYMADGKK
ncbi:hypothetical protein QUF70_06495 [Desulfobacterales bacterium HSG17]|nr:hypothetical protein [Desulfobacterales bacterium HSG17]